MKSIRIPMQRVRSATRTLRRNPRFALTVLIVLSLGIGTVSALFSVVDKVLLEPLPYRDPDRLVQLITWVPTDDQGGQRLVSIPKYNLWQTASRSFESMAAAGVNVPDMNFTVGIFRSTLKAARVSASYFHVLGAEISAGRTFSPIEDSPNGPKTVVISDALWRRYFRSDANLVGHPILLNDAPYVVVGILARDAQVDSSADIWLPLRADPESVDYVPTLRMIARLKKGVSLENADLELNSVNDREIWAMQIAMVGDTFTRGSAKAVPLREIVVGDVRPSLYVLVGAAGFLLAICCLNIGGLFLARATQRTREIAVRLALGAERKQIAFELLAESFVLSLGVGATGLLLGFLGVRLVLAASPDQLPRMGANGSAIALDWKIFLFTFCLSVLAAFGCALAPALSASRTDINVLINNDNAARSGMTIGRNGWRPFLVSAEVAISLVLLVGAGLLMRTFVAKRALNRGFDDQNVVTFSLSLNSPRFANTADVAHLVQYGEEKIKAIHGVESVAATNALPLLPSFPMPFSIYEHDQLVGQYNGTATWHSVSPDYFKVFQIRLLRGRMFTQQDNEHAPAVVLINTAMMHRYWRETNANPIGHFIKIGKGWDSDPSRQIVGVVADVRDPSAEREPAMYVPIAQISDSMTARNGQVFPLIWAVRTDKAGLGAVATIQDELVSVSSGQPVGKPTTMREALAALTARYQFYLGVLTIFSVIALVLTASGIYGLMAYSVQRRRKELAVRAAFGATPRDARELVMKQALQLTAYGVLAGIPLAIALTRVTVSSVFGIQTWDPATLAYVALALCLVSLFAAYVPSRTAGRIDAVAALRSND